MDEILDKLANEPERKPPRRKKRFDDAFEGMGDRKPAKATKKKWVVAGRYMRRMFTFRPDQLDELEHIAEELNMSKAATVRWLVDSGIAGFRDGDRPDMVPKEVTMVYDEPDWSEE